MSEANEYERLSIWQLVRLGHELDDIAHKLRSFASQLNRGVIDVELYESTQRQLHMCGYTLRASLRKKRSRR